MPVQETEESNIVDQLQVVCRLDDELETSSESSDSGIDSPKLDDTQQSDLISTLRNCIQNLNCTKQSSPQELKELIIKYSNNKNDLLHILISKFANECSNDVVKKTINYLIENEVDINSKNKYGLTSLHLAIQNDNTNIVKHLLTIKNINPFIQNNNGKTPFDYAKGKKEILRTLIEAKYKHGSTKNKFFHFAVKHNQINAVKYLIEKQRYQVDLRDCQQSTPLHIAAMEGHVDIVKYLIAKGANVNHVSRLGNIALMLAVSCINGNEKNKLEIIKLLINNGANINFVPGKDKAFCQMSVLHFAVEHFIQNSNQDSLNIVSYLSSLPKLNVNICDDRNETALHYVVKSKLDISSQLRILGTLLTRKDIDLLATDNEGRSPLDYAQKPVLDVLYKYIEIKESYNQQVAKSNNLAPYCLSALMIVASFMLIVESSILLNETITMQNDYAHYMCASFIILAAVGMLSGVSILICNHIEKEKIEEDFKYQVKNLNKSGNSTNIIVTQPQIENVQNIDSKCRWEKR